VRRAGRGESEAVVVEAVAPRHVGSVLAGERGEGTVGAQLT